MFASTRLLAAALLTVAGIGSASAADTFISATVEGVLAPGVYGRIDLGNAPPPPVLYAQPMIITRPAVGVPQRPLYLYVPPGHAKNWAKHCGKYNACAQPVYFVNVDSRGKYVYKDKHRGGDRGPRDAHSFGRDDGPRHGNDRDWDHGPGKGQGKGHGRGKDRD